MAIGKVLVWDEDGITAWMVYESAWKGKRLVIKAKNWHSRSGEFTCSHLTTSAYSPGECGQTVLKNGARMLQNGQDLPGSGGHRYAADSSLSLGIKAFEEEVAKPLSRLLITPKNRILVEAAFAQRAADLAQAKADKYAAQAEALQRQAAQL